MANAAALFFILSAIGTTVLTIKTGGYVIQVDSIDNVPKADRSGADWHFYLKRVSKTDKVIDGHYVVKRAISKPKVDIETYFMTRNKFVKVDLNHPDYDFCESSVGRDFIDEHFEGNSTWGDDCVITPGVMAVRNDRKIDLNKLTHDIYQKVFYGTYKLLMAIRDGDGRVVCQIGWIITAKETSV